LAGPRRTPPAAHQAVFKLLAPTLFAALIATQVFSSDRSQRRRCERCPSPT
jgi:hypothetical protein